MKLFIPVVFATLFTIGVRADDSQTAPPIPRFSTNYMDRSVDPAKDFYHYADGNWVKENPVPADKSRWASFSELAERNWYLIHDILDSAAADTAAPAHSPRREVGDFFASAMDTNRIEKLGFKPIAGDLKRIDHVQSLKNLFALLADFHDRGIGGIFGSGFGPDAKNSAIYAYHLGQGGLSLPDRDYYLKDSFADTREKYRAHVTKMFTLLGETPEVAAADASTVLALETELAKACRPRVELRDPDKNYNKFLTPEFIAKDPSIPWESYFTESGLAPAPATAGKNMMPLTYEIVGQPEFFDAVNKLLQDRPLADWKAYLRWHLLHASAPYLQQAVEEENFAFFGKVLSGQEQQEPRWKRAAHVIDGSIGEALGQLYVEKYFPPEAKARMNDLVENLKAVFKDRLEKLDWMTDATRAKALEKFARFTQKIGYPDKFRDYSSVQIRRDDYLGNVRRAEAFESHRELVRLGKPVDKTEWGMTPETVNAYFNPLQNEIVFPAGILQPPFFDISMDDAVNYGAIGVVIGHEMTHGYDDEGRKFDADGNLKSWWTDADAKAFDERAQKVVDEYNKFEPLPDLHVNGKLTLGENIADLGGVNIAYDALERVLAKDPSKRKTIDGFTPEQRFFISFAQIWRSNTRDAEARRLVTVDPHSPGQFRAYGPLLNFQPFYDAFGIKAGDPIWEAPELRAKIW
ncbi:MAG TPA: M13 family metallopeptidase [Verrucomicrobiae bacterium]|jgi:putative endopeptidase|nr:M13 family metallopeptidase [Verrucomicrobiae bacterium]